ncbi:protein O-mannosyl-transferase TMTC4 [Episyrphus balteatus]|uniref:protein O-mannosyl-transferase TMTC4 n=1 Tax=Episyrphus balteatus TaxID=286459 RepID=UPI0024867072|nr:protein O-mannosyl-transferase TMTC4 [Episyrphus balteatus]
MDCNLKTSSMVILIFTIISYYHSLPGTFVFDDTVAIVKNKDVTKSPISLHSLLNHDFWGANLTDTESHKSYRPLTTLLFHFEYSILQLRSYHMKTINLIMHFLNCLLVLYLFYRITRNKTTAFIGALLFAVHPIHTEAVCGIVGRAELLFCFCFLISIILIDSIDDNCSLNRMKCLGIVVISAVGLLCKESAITILPTCVFYDLVKRAKKEDLTWSNIIRKIYVIFALITSLLLYLRLWIQNFESPKFNAMDNPIAANEDLLTRILSQNFLYSLNCWILICPIWLSFDWALGSVELVTTPQDIRFSGIVLMYLIIVKILQTKSRTLIIGLGFLIIPFLPACGVIKVGFVIAERVLYVPSIGFCLVVACSFQNLAAKISEHKKLFFFAFLSVIYLLTLRTRERSTEWMTEELLFSSALTVCPNNAKVHYNIARLATDKGEKKKAFYHYHKAIDLYGNYEAALMNLGNLYREIGDYQTAEYYIKQSLEVLEEFPAAWMNLGIVQATRKKHSEALQSYRNALKYRKHYPVCYYNMGNLFLEIHEFSEAIKHWQESVALNPYQPKAWANILTLLDNQQLFDDALRLSNQAMRYLPNETSIMFIRANVLGKMKNYVEAEELYKRVIQAEPMNALYHSNFGVLYHRWGNVDLATKSYLTAIKLDPKSKTARDNLSKLRKK